MVTPFQPGDDAGCPVEVLDGERGSFRHPGREAGQQSRHLVAAVDGSAWGLGQTAAVADDHDVRRQDLHQGIQVCVRAGLEEAVHYLGVDLDARPVARVSGIDAVPGAVDQLTRCRLVAPQRGRHLRVRPFEHLPEHERGSFQRREPFEHHQEGHRQRVGELCRGRRVPLGVRVLYHRLRQPGSGVGLSSGLGPPEVVEREPADDRCEERLGVRHGRAVGLGPAEPSLLQHILGVRYGSEDPVGHAHQVWSMTLEHGDGDGTRPVFGALVRVGVSNVHQPLLRSREHSDLWSAVASVNKTHTESWP